MNKFILTLIITLASISITNWDTVFSQPMLQGEGGMQMRMSRMFNPATVQTVSGTVEEVITTQHRWEGIHLHLKSNQKVIDVRIGPAGFLSKNGFEIQKGDTLEVTGSEIRFGDRDLIVASKIKKGDQELKLRDDQGFPMWAGWRSR